MRTKQHLLRESENFNAWLEGDYLPHLKWLNLPLDECEDGFLYEL